MRIFRYIIFFLLFSIYNSAPALDTTQGILHPDFSSLTVQKDGDFMAPPVVRLGSGEQVIVSFDEIGDDWSRLQYRLVHCNADWQPSRLIESEYVDGFNFADIEDYAFSGNTFVNYTNYRFAVPSEDLQVLVSGNYVVEVFSPDEPDEVLLRARFQVSEDTAFVEGNASPHTDFGYNSEWQQVNLGLNTAGKDINPYQDIIISVIQNRRPDTEVFVSHPLRSDGSKVIYEHNQNLIFPASNEYRRFETVRADYPGMNIEAVDFADRRYQAWVVTDRDRSEGSYSYDQTQKGRFKIDSYNASDPDLGSDYVDVHFALDYPPLTNGSIYINGDFTYNRYDDQYRMQYDPERQLYTLTLPLKQGSYNYQYVVVKDGETKGSTAPIEGNKYETQNEYNVTVYYRTPTGRYDRLIGRTVIRE